MRQVVLTRHIRPEVYGWLCFGVMCLGFVFVKVAGFGQAVVAPDLIREFGLGPSELGLLTALYLWGYAAIQIPTGVLADTLGPRRAVTVFMLVAAIGTFLFGTAAAFSVSAIGRALMGVGTGILFVCNAKMISQWFRADQFATLQGILLMVGNLGVFASAAPLALLVGAVGWRQSFVLLAAFGAAVAILVFILVHDRPGEVPSSPADAVAGAPEASALRAGALAQAARSVLLNRNIWLLAIYAFVLYGALMAVQGLWAVPYLMDIHGLTRQDASNVITLWPVGTIIASPIWGYLSDRVLGTRKWVVMAGVLLFSLPFLILTLYPSGLPLWSFYALFFWCGATNSTVAVSFALLADVVPRWIIGTALGLYNLWLFVGGAVYQQVSGVILGMFPAATGQGSADGYRAIFLLCLVGSWLGTLAILGTREERAHVSHGRDGQAVLN